MMITDMANNSCEWQLNPFIKRQQLCIVCIMYCVHYKPQNYKNTFFTEVLFGTNIKLICSSEGFTVLFTTGSLSHCLLNINWFQTLQASVRRSKVMISPPTVLQRTTVVSTAGGGSAGFRGLEPLSDYSNNDWVWLPCCPAEDQRSSDLTEGTWTGLVWSTVGVRGVEPALKIFNRPRTHVWSTFSLRDL